MDELETKHEADPAENGSLAPQFAAATQPSYSRTLFFAVDGLRPGWGLAFYGITFYLLNRWLGAAWGAVQPDLSPLWSDLAHEFLALVAAAIPAVALARVEKRSWGAFGLPLRNAFGRLFWIGSFWGFSSITILMLALYGFHTFDFGHLALHGVRVAKFAAFWVLVFLVVGLFEEFMMRGYTQFTLARAIRFWPAAIGLSVVFGLFHLQNVGESWTGALAAAVIGLFFCLTLRRTGNLWFAVGFHAAWDWGETFFYSVPDSGLVAPGHLLSSSLHGARWLSGGGVGPEGSALCFVVIALTWIAFDRTYPPAVVPAKNTSA